MKDRLIQITTEAMDLQAQKATLTVRAKTIRIYLPWIQGDITWRRGVSVGVAPLHGESYNIPIHDTTRLFQLIIIGTSIFVSIMLFYIIKRRKNAHVSRNTKSTR